MKKINEFSRIGEALVDRDPTDKQRKREISRKAEDRTAWETTPYGRRPKRTMAQTALHVLVLLVTPGILLYRWIRHGLAS